jgi:hypothetical protein
MGADFCYYSADDDKRYSTALFNPLPRDPIIFESPLLLKDIPMTRFRTLAFVCLILPLPAFAEPPTVMLDGTIPTLLPDTEIGLTLTAVEDARCPPDVQCIWEGMYRVTFTVTGAPDTPTIVLCNACDDAGPTAVVAGQTLALVQMQPSTTALARLGRAITVADYQVTIALMP